MSLVPIHNHSHYSALDGWSTIDEIFQRCQEIGVEAVGLTDHGNVSGHLEFLQKSQKYGIKPLPGVEAYHGERTTFKGQERDQAHLVLGAMNNEGLKNLWRITDKAASNFRFVPRVTHDLLKEFSTGMYATSACVQGLVSQGIKKGDLTDLDLYLDAFRENFYIEIHTYPTEDQKLLNFELIKIAQERGVPLVYANDAHMASPSDYECHDVYVALQTGDTIFTPPEKRKMWHPPALFIQDEQEVRKSLEYLPETIVDECLKNTVALAEKCDVSLPEIRRHLPIFVPSECEFLDEKKKKIETSADLFMHLAVEGCYKRYGEPSEEIWERLEHELDVFIGAGLEDYFLQIWDLCQFSDKEKILRSPGRGSAPGSLVVYCLGISDIDPIHYDLYFERFYNAGREKGLPDIDIDFPVKDRDRIKKYLGKKHGESRVYSIGTITKLKPKAALNRTYKAFGISEDVCKTINKIVSSVPDLEIVGSDSVGWKNQGEGLSIYVMDHVGDQIDEYLQSLPSEDKEIVEFWLEFISRVVGRVSGYGVHASGVVVSDTDLDCELPAFWSASKKTKATIFPMSDVEKRGFLKDDILGLRNLDTLDEWVSLMGDKLPNDFSWFGLDRKHHPDEMWEMLEQGYGLGIFQIEDSNYPLKLCKEIKPRSAEDLALIVALNRPGPIRAGSPERYIRRRNGEEEVRYEHPILENVLSKTNGEWIYQEQVIKFFSELGYSPSDADAVRKILGKKKPEEMARLYKGEGDWKNKGYYEIAVPILGEQLAKKIGDELEDFALYSFNQSHSTVYGAMAERTTYAKWKGPTEFMLACIKTNPDDAALYVAEARRMGIEVSPPDIRKGGTFTEHHGDEIIFGFSNIKGITDKSSSYLVELRDKYDFYSKECVLKALEIETKAWEEGDRKKQSPKTRLKSNQVDALERAGAFDNYHERDISLVEKQKQQKELLGIILTDNSHEIFRNNADIVSECSDYDWEDSDVISIPGIITNIRETTVKKSGEQMAIAKIEHGQNYCEFAIFPSMWKRNKFLFRERNCAIMTIRKTDRGYQFVNGKLLT